MTFQPSEHRTTIATLRVVNAYLIEIIYDPGIVFHADAVAEVQRMRRELMGKRSYATLTIIPEDVDYMSNTMSQDQGGSDHSEGQLMATAVVAKASMIELLTKLYFSYFPQRQRVLVTDNEQAARTWLSEQVKEIELAEK